jgi:hypothetical protein
MPSNTFYLLGEDISTAKEVEFDTSQSIEGLRHLIAAHFAIVEPSGKQ